MLIINYFGIVLIGITIYFPIFAQDQQLLNLCAEEVVAAENQQQLDVFQPGSENDVQSVNNLKQSKLKRSKMKRSNLKKNLFLAEQPF